MCLPLYFLLIPPGGGGGGVVSGCVVLCYRRAETTMKRMAKTRPQGALIHPAWMMVSRGSSLLNAASLQSGACLLATGPAGASAGPQVLPQVKDGSGGLQGVDMDGSSPGGCSVVLKAVSWMSPKRPERRDDVACWPEISNL